MNELRLQGCSIWIGWEPQPDVDDAHVRRIIERHLDMIEESLLEIAKSADPTISLTYTTSKRRS